MFTTVLDLALFVLHIVSLRLCRCEKSENKLHRALCPEMSNSLMLSLILRPFRRRSSCQIIAIHFADLVVTVAQYFSFPRAR